MNRARFALAATLTGACLVAGPALAEQATQAPPMQSVLAGKKFTPPLKGEAQIQMSKATTKKEKDLVVTTFQVKNMSKGPIARLTCDETWYDEKGTVVGGGKGVISGMLQPNEVQTMRVESAWNPKMESNNYNFSHPNGTVKAKQVANLEGADTKEPAAKNATATKKKK
jgi:hypothetical protein